MMVSSCEVCGAEFTAETPDSLCAACTRRAEGPVSAGVSAPPSQAKPTSPRRRLAILAGVVISVLGLGIWAVWGLFKEPFRRGRVADVIRYAEKDYEGASWQALRKATSLGNLPAGMRGGVAELDRIYGYDDKNLWVVDKKGAVFRLDDGHWEFVAVIDDAGIQAHGALIEPDILLLGGKARSRGHRIHRLEPGGVRSFDLQHGKESLNWSQPLGRGDAIIPFAAGVTYLATGSGYTGTSHKLVGDQIEVLQPQKGHQEGIIVDADGTPIQAKVFRYHDGPTLQNLWISTVFGEGEVAAVGRFGRPLEPMFVVWRGSTWMRVETISLERPELYRTGWLSRDEEGRHFCVFVGPGRAAVYREGRGVTVHPITTTTSSTTIDLINVWGTGPERFWVLDRNGSVWEYHEERWHQIVRGMAETDLVFNHSWVSPTGVVFAISDDTLYRLD